MTPKKINSIIASFICAAALFLPGFAGVFLPEFIGKIFSILREESGTASDYFWGIVWGIIPVLIAMTILFLILSAFISHTSAAKILSIVTIILICLDLMSVVSWIVSIPVNGIDISQSNVGFGVWILIIGLLYAFVSCLLAGNKEVLKDSETKDIGRRYERDLEAVQTYHGETGVTQQADGKKISETNDGGAKVTQKGKVGYLQCISGTNKGSTIPLNPGETIIIGRDPAVSHLIAYNSHVSKRHCTIMYDSQRDSYIVRDISTNGIYLNNGKDKLPSNTKVSLHHGAKISLGKSDEVFKLL